VIAFRLVVKENRDAVLLAMVAVPHTAQLRSRIGI
jgi:hypothetical protein